LIRLWDQTIGDGCRKRSYGLLLATTGDKMKMAVEPVAPGVVKVILDGRLDITGASVIDLQFSAIAGSHKGIVVDLANVSFLASIGIRTLLLGAKLVQRRGGSFVLLNPIGEVERVLEVTGVTDLMPIYRDSEAAVAAASSSV
jgi:anti-anti-sigma factor